jgi:hypothetical protein
MKLFRSTVVMFVFGILTFQATYAACPTVKVSTFGSGWGVSETEEEATAVAMEMAKEDGIKGCLDMIAVRCEVANCSMPKNVKDPKVNVSIDFCYGEDETDWTCVADSDARCSAKCE